MAASTSRLWWGVVLDAPDPRQLAAFYAAMLGWTVQKDTPDWVTLAPPDGVAYLAFARAEDFVRPVWPSSPGAQQMMMHLDLEVRELQGEVQKAVRLGATVAEYQPQEHVRVLLDPAGHPFCLYVQAPAGPVPEATD